MALSRYLILLTLLASLGCGKDQAAAPPSDRDPKAVPIRTATIDVDQLPPLDATMPPVDDGRLLIAPPQGWGRAPRSENYLVQFYLDPSRQARLPRIVVHVEPWEHESISTVNSDNVLPFAELVKQQINPETLAEPVLALMIGQRACARYVVRAAINFRSSDGTSSQRVTIERQVLETVVNNRRYTLDLQVHPGTIVRYRDHAYAVLAGMQFP